MISLFLSFWPGGWTKSSVEWKICFSLQIKFSILQHLWSGINATAILISPFYRRNTFLIVSSLSKSSQSDYDLPMRKFNRNLKCLPYFAYFWINILRVGALFLYFKNTFNLQTIMESFQKTIDLPLLLRITIPKELDNFMTFRRILWLIFSLVSFKCLTSFKYCLDNLPDYKSALISEYNSSARFYKFYELLLKRGHQFYSNWALTL